MWERISQWAGVTLLFGVPLLFMAGLFLSDWENSWEDMQSWYFKKFGINAASTAGDYLNASDINQVQVLGKLCDESMPCTSIDLLKEYGRENVMDLYNSDDRFYLDDLGSNFKDLVMYCFLDEVFDGKSYQYLGVISLDCGDKIAAGVFKAAGL